MVELVTVYWNWLIYHEAYLYAGVSVVGTGLWMAYHIRVQERSARR